MPKRVIAALVLTATAALIPGRAQAEPSRTVDHCVQHVMGRTPTGELLLSEARCYSTFDRAMQVEGVDAWGDGAAADAAELDAALVTFTLGIHYDWANQNPGGGSTSTVGTSCTGGYVNLPSSWNNRISSTANGCPAIYHYDLVNLGGAVTVTTGAGGNLGTLSNRVTSIQYL